MTTISVFSSLLSIYFAANLSPNLCDDVYLDPTGAPYRDVTGQMLSRYCAWSGPDVPVWDGDVCCTVDDDGAACVAPLRNGRCRVGFKMYCEYGETVAGGSVVCYQPFPSQCDFGLCVQGPEVAPDDWAVHVGCCSTGGVCHLQDEYTIFDGCDGYYLSCDYGFQNEDGTVECYN